MTRLAFILLRPLASRAGLLLLVLLPLCLLAPLAPAEDTQPVPADLSSSSPDPLAADDQPPVQPDPPVDPKLIKRPSDFAPAEQIVVERDDRAFRKPGTLLEAAQGSPPLVNQTQLTNRKLAMFEGQRLAAGYSYPDRLDWTVADRAAASAAPVSTSSRSSLLLIFIPLSALGVLYLVTRLGLLDRKSDEDQPPKKQPRLKVTITSR